MMIFGEIPGAIIAIETDFKCFCLKCNLMNGISKEVYKPVSKKIILEKSKCKDCGTTKRTYRKYAAFCKKSYKNMQHFGEQRTKKYNKLAWTVLAPEVQVGFSEIEGSVVRGMEHIAVQRGLKPMKAHSISLEVNQQAKKTRTRRRGGPFGGMLPARGSPHPYYSMNRAYQNQEDYNYPRAQQAMMQQQIQQQAMMQQMQQQAMMQQRNRTGGGLRGYCSPSCMCNHCTELDVYRSAFPAHRRRNNA